MHPFSLPMASLREAVWTSLQKTLGGQPPALRLPRQEGGNWEPRQAQRIGRQIQALHEAYTTGGGDFAHDENPIHSNLAGYQLYFMPRNLFRVYHTLQDLPWQPLPAPLRLAPWLDGTSAAPTLRVADLGCGTGAFSLAVLCWLASLAPHGSVTESAFPAVHMTLVDQGRTLLGLAQATLQACAQRLLPGLRLTVELHADGVERFLDRAGPPHAIVGSALMLNELRLLGPGRAAQRPLRVTEPLRPLVRPGGLLLLVEAGTRKGYMNLMAMREQLLPAPILYPCPHGKPCPLWNNRVSQWCHSTRPLPRPFFFDAELQRWAGMRFAMREVNLAALAMQLPGGQPAGTGAEGGAQAPFQARRGMRLISAPMGGSAPAAGSPPARPAPTTMDAARRVLACAADGQLHEVADPGLGSHTRGLWLPEAHVRILPAAAAAAPSPRGKKPPAPAPRGKKARHPAPRADSGRARRHAARRRARESAG